MVYGKRTRKKRSVPAAVPVPSHIQEKFDNLSPLHQELAIEIIDSLLVLGRLQEGLDRFLAGIEELQKPPKE